jgi:uncharacterized RDD family membrane protein YckC
MSLSKFDEIHNETINPIAQAPLPAFPPIAGFWKRLLAFAIDALILGVFGQILALVFSNFFYSIGPYGRPIGWTIALFYFGIFNSKLGGGQTLGKRIMKLAVRDETNKSISFGRSVARISIIIAPALFNGWAIPILQNTAINVILTVIVFGLGGALEYTMIFNRGTRQGIHDLLVKTYVVNLNGPPIEAFPKSARIHWVISGALVGLVALVSITMALFSTVLLKNDSLSSLQNTMSGLSSLYNSLENDPRFFSVSVVSNTIRSSQGEKNHILDITAWYKGKLGVENSMEVINDIAKTVMDSGFDLSGYDGMRITISAKYDIGFATGFSNTSDGASISDWRERIK